MSIIDELAKAKTQAPAQSAAAPSAVSPIQRAARQAPPELIKDLGAFLVSCVGMTIIRTMLYTQANNYFWLYQSVLPWILVVVAIYFDRTNQYLPMRGLTYAFAAYVLSPRVAAWLVSALVQGKLW